MKRVVMIGICVLCASFCQAQTFQEWFNQKKTQIKYLVEQIAAFETYAGYVKKGYNITSNGLGNIRNLKKGDFNLHDNYFNSLKQVNPVIRRYSRVADIIAMQAYILKTSRSALQVSRGSGMLTRDEMSYLEDVHGHLLSESATDIDQLAQLVTNNELEMKDDERIKRIDELYEAIRDKYAFLQSFSGGVSVLMLQRTKEQREVNSARKIHGVQ